MMLEKLLLAMAATLAFYVTFRPTLPSVHSIAIDGRVTTGQETQVGLFSQGKTIYF